MLPLDVADANAVFAAADRVERELGPIDVWINDAMLTVFSPLSQMTPEEFARVTNVTYLGYVYGTMAALHYMRRRNKGTIIQVGSALAYRGIPLQTAYCGAKHAIRGFTDSLRSELLHEGSEIGLTMIQLPAVNTPQFDWARTHLSHKPRPVPPVVQPEAIARVILKAVRKPRREYWLGFSTIKVILASMAVPTFLDHYLARNGYDAQEQKALISPDRRDNLLSPVTNLHRTRGSFGSEAHEQCDGRFRSGRPADSRRDGCGTAAMDWFCCLALQRPAFAVRLSGLFEIGGPLIASLNASRGYGPGDDHPDIHIRLRPISTTTRDDLGRSDAQSCQAMRSSTSFSTNASLCSVSLAAKSSVMGRSPNFPKSSRSAADFSSSS